MFHLLEFRYHFVNFCLYDFDIEKFVEFINTLIQNFFFILLILFAAFVVKEFKIAKLFKIK